MTQTEMVAAGIKNCLVIAVLNQACAVLVWAEGPSRPPLPADPPIAGSESWDEGPRGASNPVFHRL